MDFWLRPGRPSWLRWCVCVLPACSRSIPTRSGAWRWSPSSPPARRQAFAHPAHWASTVRGLWASACITAISAQVAIALAALPASLYACTAACPFVRTADAVAPSLALASSVVSIGCLEAGCDYGTPRSCPGLSMFNDPRHRARNPAGHSAAPHAALRQLAGVCLFVVCCGLLHRPHREGEVLGAMSFPGRPCQLSAHLPSDTGRWMAGVSATQFSAAAMVLAGGGPACAPPASALPRSPRRMPIRVTQLAVPAEAERPASRSVFSPAHGRDQPFTGAIAVAARGRADRGQAGQGVAQGAHAARSYLDPGRAPTRLPCAPWRKTIPLEIVYEDEDLAVINKPAGMMVARRLWGDR